jgi:hypothetical protein
MHCCHPYPCDFFPFLGAEFQVVGRLLQLSKMSILKIIQEVIIIIIIICDMLSSSVLHFSGSGPFAATSQSLRPPVAYPGIFFRGGVQQIQLRTEDRENGDPEAAVIWYKKFHFI